MLVVCWRWSMVSVVVVVVVMDGWSLEDLRRG